LCLLHNFVNKDRDRMEILVIFFGT